MPEFTNVATLTYNGIVTNSNIAVGTLQDVLTAEKTAISGGYAAGDEITFVISLVNSGSSELNDLTVTDDLGAYSFGAQQVVPLTYVADSLRLYINGAEQTAPGVTAGPPLVIADIDIPGGANAMLIYQAAINGYAPLGAGESITNQAQISGAGLSEVSAEATLNSGDTLRLSIAKFISPAAVTEDQRLTYSFIVQNSGNTAADAADAVVIRDTFSPLLNSITVQLNGTELTEGTDYTYDAASGEFATQPGIITVPAATYAQADSGIWEMSPGVAELTVSGII